MPRSASRETSTYQTIEIDDVENRLTYRAWTDAGEVVDRLEITKPRPRGGPPSPRPDLARGDRDRALAPAR